MECSSVKACDMLHRNAGCREPGGNYWEELIVQPTDRNRGSQEHAQESDSCKSQGMQQQNLALWDLRDLRQERQAGTHLGKVAR